MTNSCYNLDKFRNRCSTLSSGCNTCNDVLFRKVVISAVMGTDEPGQPHAPKNGAYTNALVYYEATGVSYLYSSDGIYTKIADIDVISPVESVNGRTGAVVITLEELGGKNQQQIQLMINDAVNNVRDEIPTKVSELSNDSNYQNATQVASAISPVSGKVATIESAINKAVINNIEITGNTSTDTINLKNGKVNIKTGATTSATVPFPVASASTAGIMNSATFQGLQQTTDIANGLLNGAVAVSGLAEEPTQAQLTSAWKTATGRTTLMNRAVLYDITNEKLWTYYTNTSTWYSAAAGGGSVDVQPWTNTQAGIVKGSTEDGQIFAENDGTGSVNGWDDVKTDIQNLENAGYQTATDVANTIANTKVSDLSDGDDYVKNTDYATSSVGGVVKVSTTIGTYTTSDGELYASEKSYSQYSGMTRNGFISKGTLENVITGKELENKVEDVKIDGTSILDGNKVANIPYANGTTAGVWIAKTIYGLTPHPENNGTVFIQKSTNQEIDAKSNNYKPIVPANLDYAIEKGLGDNSLTWTTAEQISATGTIGTVRTITLTQAEYDALTTYDDNTNYQIIEG